MLKNYRNELIAICVIFGLIAYGINVALAAPKAAPKKEVTKSAPAKKAEEPKKDPNRKKPTLKKKFQK